ncbi:MAG: double-strand break repair protein AddB [Parasphingorhabdus sp.]|nr:double-strand break repair protein AddB [Parasphingorhabdus sp.]
MSEHRRPSVFTISAHGGFADGLARGLIDRFGKDPLELARGLLLLPNNRARRAVTEAFIRESGGGLLLPRMAVVGALDLDEAVGIALDGVDMADDLKPAVPQMSRLLTLARLVEQEGQRRGQKLLAQDALALAQMFAATLDQLIADERSLRDLIELGDAIEIELPGHWQASYGFFIAVAQAWYEELDARGQVDDATRRNALFDAVARRWRAAPPAHFIAAVGITTAAPAIARLLRCVADLPRGLVVLPGLDLAMADTEWDALIPRALAAEGQPLQRAQETHPQYHLRLLLDRMSIARGEVQRWRRIGESGARAERSRAIGNMFTAPEFTARWENLPNSERSMAGVRLIETANSAGEAQAIALLVREALETPAQRIAIITPDRALARRISAHLLRWDIAAEDSAGTALAQTPPAILMLLLLECAAQGFPPADLLALLKHPLVAAGDERLRWLEQVRTLDLLLRGPRPAAGLAGVTALFAGTDWRKQALRDAARDWWQQTAVRLEPLERLASGAVAISQLLETVQNLLQDLTGGTIWAGPAGRELATFWTSLLSEIAGTDQQLAPQEWQPWFTAMLTNIAVRPPYGGHPRVALYGLLEARLQTADIVICAGLNEGVWPQSVSPDPWLAPAIRTALGLPAQERQIGLSAHDLAEALGAKHVVLTRAKRDASGPAIASRFLLRMKAMCGDNLRHDVDMILLAGALDRAIAMPPVGKPAPQPSAEQRNVSLSVTEVETLQSDPYSFYARKILRLSAIDMVDAEPTYAWRGSAAHDILFEWAAQDNFTPGRLMDRAREFLNRPETHPIMRALWSPRLLAALEFVEQQTLAGIADGRKPMLYEESGAAEIAGVRINGRVDRLDQFADGSLGIVDYKTGKPPSARAVKEGFRIQLGLLGAIAEARGFRGLAGPVAAFEYWSLSRGNSGFGFVAVPYKEVPADDMVGHATAILADVVAQYIKGNSAFLPKLQPEYCFPEYDQLMRLEERYGRAE